MSIGKGGGGGGELRKDRRIEGEWNVEERRG